MGYPPREGCAQLERAQGKVARLRKQMESHMVARSQLDAALDTIEKNGEE